MSSQTASKVHLVPDEGPATGAEGFHLKERDILARDEPTLVAMTRPTASAFIGLLIVMSAMVAATLVLQPTQVVALADHEDLITEKIPIGEATFTLEPLASNFQTPLWGAAPPYSTTQIFIVDQVGTITAQSTVDSDESHTFLDVGPDGADLLVTLKSEGFDERGLLGLAFHPRYRKNGLLYTYTSEPLGPTPDFTTLTAADERESDASLSVIREWRVDEPRRTDAVVDRTTSRIVLRIEQPQTNHNAGAIVFGGDAMLYVALGDGGARDDEGIGHGDDGRGNGQNLGEGNVLGKILRIDPAGTDGVNGQYGVPGDNPFVGIDGADEVFAFGFRNPFRISFDNGTGQLIAADVGQRDIEEVDVVIAGGNYGWPIKEGTFLFSGNGVDNRGFAGTDSPGVPAEMIDPIAQYDHDEGTSVTGGFVYRGRALPELEGSYIFGDLTRDRDSIAGRFLQITPDGRLVEIIPTNHDTNRLLITGFGRDTQGELYVMGLQPTSRGDLAGIVYRLVPASDA